MKRPSTLPNLPTKHWKTHTSEVPLVAISTDAPGSRPFTTLAPGNCGPIDNTTKLALRFLRLTAAQLQKQIDRTARRSRGLRIAAAKLSAGRFAEELIRLADDLDLVHQLALAECRRRKVVMEKIQKAKVAPAKTAPLSLDEIKTAEAIRKAA